LFERIGKTIVNDFYRIREREYDVALSFLSGCKTVLDAGCGTGTFLERAPSTFLGIDINPDNVAYCQERGLKVQVGSVLDIPHPDRAFDGVHCSHVLQVLRPEEAAQAIKELARVTRSGGLVVISTLNSFRRFYRHPENVRAYPPDALRRLFARQGGSTSPMFPGMPNLIQEDIWLRRKPVVEFYASTNHALDRIAGVLNALQYVIYLRSYWNYDSYIIKLRRK
jgi:SAM-dependent methyltransferase